MPTTPRTNNSSEYHRQRRINEPELYKARGRDYSRRFREKKKQALLQAKLDEENKNIESEIINMTVDDLADLVIDNNDSDPDQTPAGVI